MSRTQGIAESNVGVVVRITAGSIEITAPIARVDEVTPADRAWERMVAHASVAARTRGDERTAARLAGRQAYLEFQRLRDAEDAAFLAQRSRP